MKGRVTGVVPPSGKRPDPNQMQFQFMPGADKRAAHDAFEESKKRREEQGPQVGNVDQEKSLPRTMVVRNARTGLVETVTLDGESGYTSAEPGRVNDK